DDTAPDQTQSTLLLLAAAEGDASAAERLAPMIYDNLRRLASARLGGNADWTCQPTAIVHEAYLRLADQDRVDWQGRTHFFAIGAEMVRRVIADEARKRGRQKRGGGWGRVTLDGAAFDAGSSPVDPIELEDALTQLAEVDERAARVVSLRFYGGLTEPEAAAILGVSERTVRGDWRSAKAFLRRALAARDEAHDQ
ncbi:MAG: ECF-type sigma factor, partial [Planctomycetota bacterium]